MALTHDDLNNVLKLAHLEVPEAEKKEILPQLQRILDYMDILNEADLSNVQPTSYSIDEPTALRDDVVVPRADLLLEKNAPEWENNCFKVPKILGE